MARLIADKFKEWEAECDARFNQLKANEEELNRIFIDIYGLQDELTPEVEETEEVVETPEVEDAPEIEEAPEIEDVPEIIEPIELTDDETVENKPEKKKKKGFFSRLFGRKGGDDE